MSDKPKQVLEKIHSKIYNTNKFNQRILVEFSCCSENGSEKRCPDTVPNGCSHRRRMDQAIGKTRTYW